MGIEAIKGAGMTYQGGNATAEVRAEAAHKIEVAEIANTSDAIAQDTMAMNTKETSNEGGGQSPANPEAEQSKIKKAVEEINKKSKESEAVFGIHEGTNKVTIKIVDKKTKEVIKEFPPEKTLDMIARVWEMAGLMVDEKR